MTTLICSCSGFANVPMIVNEMIWTRCLAGSLMQLVSNMKVNLSQPLSHQLVCNQVVKTTIQFLECIYYGRKSQKQVLEVATSPAGVFPRHYGKIPKGW